MKRNSTTQILAIAISIGLAFGTASCKKETDTDDSGMMRSASYMYEFNNGQVVPTAAYEGMHMDNLTATMKVEEKSSASVEISVTLENTVQGEMYMIHAHDAADPATTPNGTPYNETPNSEILVQMVTGNGGSVTVSQMVNKSYDYITNDYSGFFVVHDPLQQISTTNISTYLIVGTFAREQGMTSYTSATFNYNFNNGQLVPAYAYSGSHPNNLSARLKIQQTAEGSRVSIALMNTLNGEMYMIHAHDMAEPSTTPNGTPYNETPNGSILATMVNGNGSTAYNSQLSTMTVAEITNQYDGFLVVHDPLRPISTVDPTTYIVLGVFARN